MYPKKTIILCILLAIYFSFFLSSCEEEYEPYFVMVGGRVYSPIYHGAVRTSENGIHWPNEHKELYTEILNSVCYYSDRYVMVGELSTIYYSTDGITWTPGTYGLGVNLKDVVGGQMDSYFLPWKPRFVAVGDNGVILHSINNGATWYPAPIIPVDVRLNAVAFGQVVVNSWSSSRFVAVGRQHTTNQTDSRSDTIIWSADGGLTWIEKSSGGSPYEYFDVAFGNGRFITVGQGGTILYSENAVSWHLANTPFSNAILGVTWGFNKWVATSTQGKVLYSTNNGVSWKQGNSPVSGLNFFLTDVIYSRGEIGNPKFYAVGYNFDEESVVIVSENGINWSLGRFFSNTDVDYKSIAARVSY
ncbi:MAG: hypothetical protein GF421_11175 [Candidatus Aminicenantes bacterium]|nr:hypothetical protein [Candidatus Aminicenantes bacterium]